MAQGCKTELPCENKTSNMKGVLSCGQYSQCFLSQKYKFNADLEEKVEKKCVFFKFIAGGLVP